jgi:acetoacetate decarboxylase
MESQSILACSGMPLAAPSFGEPPFRLTGRAVLSVTYESEAEAIGAALPEPLASDGSLVTVKFIDTAESPFGAYRACAISLAAKFGQTPVAYCHALLIDQEGPIYAGREIWGFPATRGEPELILGENRVAGVLDLGYGRHLRASIPVAGEIDPKEFVTETAQATCKLIPGTDGGTAIAQLVSVAPEANSIKHYWRGAAQLQADPGSPLESFPILNIKSGYYVFADMTLPFGRVMYDYLQNTEET